MANLTVNGAGNRSVAAQAAVLWAKHLAKEMNGDDFQDQQNRVADLKEFVQNYENDRAKQVFGDERVNSARLAPADGDFNYPEGSHDPAELPADSIGAIGIHGDGVYGPSTQLVQITGISFTLAQLAAAVDAGTFEQLLFAGNDTVDLEAANNVFNAFGGNDLVRGGGGSNTIHGGAGNDTLSFYSATASAGNRLYGDAGNDALWGDNGVDVLDGGAGADTMKGARGNDTYIVDSLADVVDETYGNGVDIVRSSVTWSLVASPHATGDLEQLVLTGNGAVNGTGNGLDNAITGNAAVNTLSGGAGNDTINGSGGADRMFGGLGNDRLFVDNAADKVFEAANQGRDMVLASVSWALAAGQHVETLTTTLQTGTGALNLTGNELAQTIQGNNGANALNGGAGNDVLQGLGGSDVLTGGPGKDTLTGGAGIDFFALNATLDAAANVDRIVDFNVAADTIRIDNAVMPALGATLGTLAAGKFWKSATGLARDADDRIVYETDTGKLSYDANGSAVGGAVHLATLAPNLALTNADFVVV